MKTTSHHIAALVLVLVVSRGTPAADRAVLHQAQQPRVLNNFVTQLFSLKKLAGDGRHTFTVENPRNGWLFFRINGLAGRSGRIGLGIARRGIADAKRETVITYERGDRKTVEAMRFLEKGSYGLQLDMADSEVALLEVRLIPMIIYERVSGGFRAMEGFPEYNRDFLRRCGMLESINTIGTYDGFPWMRQWIEQGKRAIRVAGGIHSLGTEQAAYDHWRGCMNHPGGVYGTVIDEFYPALKKNFPHWVKALRRVRRDEPGRLCLLYTAGGADSLRELIEPLKDMDFYWTPEEQVAETRETHEQLLEHGFGRSWVSGFRKAGYFPNISGRTVHSVGIFSGPSESKYNDDAYPDRNWKVLKELHFHDLATHPLHKGLAGVDMYQSPQCQEEYLRWMARLCRHYCIEGNTKRLTNDRYELNHIQNPDFEQGLDGWTLEPAAPGSIEVRHAKGYGLKVQGRHAHAGDHFLWTRRQADKPNIIRQQIKGLEPGRYYSVTMYTGDHRNLTRWQVHQVGLMVRGDIVEQPSQTIHNAWRHVPDKAFGNKDTYPNYHRIVFQARKDSAELVLSDWRHGRIPTAPVGQELIFNFIQVEPYLMPNAR